MASCLLGSTAFGALQSRSKVENTMFGMLVLATLSMGTAMASLSGNSIAPLIAAFVAFEVFISFI